MRGALGVNILNQFDLIFDIRSEEIKISTENIALDGVAIGVELWMGIPLISVDILRHESSVAEFVA